ncbi:hypothetical protein Tco_1570928 [Tanacetum coccineum]
MCSLSLLLLAPGGVGEPNLLSTSSTKEASGSSQLSSVVTGLEIPTTIGTTRKKPLTLETHTESITPRPRGRQRIGSRLNDMTLVSFEIGFDIGNNRNPYVGISSEYLYHGDQNVQYGECGALLWKADSLRGDKHVTDDSFSICCIRGKVELPVQLKPPPPLLMSLTKNKHPKSKGDDENIKLRLIGGRYCDERQHNLPTSSEVAALIVGDFDTFKNKRDIVLHKHSGSTKRISELHVSYLPLQYPLLFPYAEDGYRTDIFHKGVTDFTPTNKKTRVSMHEWFAYRIQDRPGVYSLILNGRRLASLASTSDGSHVVRGKKYVLPTTFIGNPRYMLQNYLDAMSICKFYGYPDLFITFTCNPSWPEISRYMAEKGLKSEDRPDATTRVFKIKLDNLMRDFRDRHTFGRINREPNDKLRITEQIDKYISAEISNKDTNPDLYQLVTKNMMHGPCGLEHQNYPFMVKNMCTKKFPKAFNEETFIDENGYAIYKRPDNGRTVKKSGTDLDNGFIVPYNLGLLKRYQAHINVEYCNQFGSIKYFFKYINKGPDRVTAVVDDEEVDEIKDYYDCMYLSSCEASWRIFQFDIHHRTPSVERLPFYLPDEHSVIFDEFDSIDYVLEKDSNNTTKFLQWMERNKIDDKARELLYVQFPTKYVWNAQ